MKLACYFAFATFLLLGSPWLAYAQDAGQKPPEAFGGLVTLYQLDPVTQSFDFTDNRVGGIIKRSPGPRARWRDRLRSVPSRQLECGNLQWFDRSNHRPRDFQDFAGRVRMPRDRRRRADLCFYPPQRRVVSHQTAKRQKSTIQSTKNSAKECNFSQIHDNSTPRR